MAGDELPQELKGLGDELYGILEPAFGHCDPYYIITRTDAYKLMYSIISQL